MSESRLMRALTMPPAVPNSMRLDEVPDGSDRLIVGHESLGRVLAFAM
jgi:hypothetical protein